MHDPDLTRHSISVAGGQLTLWRPLDSVELPDVGGEWAPLVPYWAVLWRSGVVLADELSELPLAGKRVVELGCGLGLPSLVAARAGATVLATDGCEEALDLLARNARENGLALETATVDWEDAGELVARRPFDLVLAADVLYEKASVAPLLALLPRLGAEVWLADPGRPVAEGFLVEAERHWSVATDDRPGARIHRLRPR